MPADSYVTTSCLRRAQLCDTLARLVQRTEAPQMLAALLYLGAVVGLANLLRLRVAEDLEGAPPLRPLTEAIAEHNAWIWFVPIDPRFVPMREDPRFAPLMESHGLAAWIEPDG